MYLKFELKVTHPFRKRRIRHISLNSASDVRASKNSSIITNRKSTMRFPSSHRWTLCVTAKCPKGGIKQEFLHLALPFISSLQVTIDKVKGKVLPYSLPSVGPAADPGVQAVSLQVTWIHPPGGRLPLLSARPPVTFPAEERHRPSADTKLYCLVTEAHACEQLAHGCYLEADRPRFEPATFLIASERSTVKPRIGTQVT